MNKQVPKNWEEHILDNIANINYGTRIVKDTAVGNKYYVYGGGDKTFLTNEYNRENTLVVARFGMSPKCTRFIEGKFFLNDSGLTVETKNENVLNQKFLNWQIYFLNDYIYSLGKGVAQKNLNVQLFKKSKIFVPASIIEQQEIVQVLDTMSDIIRLREECISHAKELIPSLFIEMFGDPRKNPLNFKMESLGKLCIKIGSGATPKGGKETYQTNGIALVRSMNIHDMEFKYKDLAYINELQAKALNNVELKENDVLFNITGASVARCCILPKNVLPARVNQHVSILRCSEKVNHYFLNALLTFPSVKEQLLNLGKTKGATREAITKTQLESFKIILPDIDHQQQFAQKAIEIESYIKEQQEELENAKQMFQSLLHHAFTGKLTKHKYGEINE